MGPVYDLSVSTTLSRRPMYTYIAALDFLALILLHLLLKQLVRRILADRLRHDCRVLLITSER